MIQLHRYALSAVALLLTLALLLSCSGQAPVSTPGEPSGSVTSLSPTTETPATVGPTTVTTAQEPVTTPPPATTTGSSATPTTQANPVTTPAATTVTATPPITTAKPVTDAPVTTTVPVTQAPVTSAPLTTVTPPPQTEPLTQPTTIPDYTAIFAEQSRNAAYLLLYDITDGRLLYTTGTAQQIYPASTTKLLVLYYALTIVDEDTIFTVGNEINIAPSDSSKAHIRVGEQYTCRDIVAALLLPSGNDAAYTLAATCGRILADEDSLSAVDAVAVFMAGVNEYAASLGLDGTHFVTPDGYHHEEHITTLSDMLEIALLARSHPLLAEIMALSTYRVTDLAHGRTQTWKNSNLLIQPSSDYYYPYATGCKTGFHTPAGSCLVATAQKGGRELMVLVFKCTNKNIRFADAKTFLELGFSLLS